MSAAAIGAAGFLYSKISRGLMRGDKLSGAIAIAQREQDLIASKVLPDLAHRIARRELRATVV